MVEAIFDRFFASYQHVEWDLASFDRLKKYNNKNSRIWPFLGGQKFVWNFTNFGE